MNRWFRRRWFDCDEDSTADVAEGKRDDLELTGLALLAAWRKQRRSEQALVS